MIQRVGQILLTAMLLVATSFPILSSEPKNGRGHNEGDPIWDLDCMSQDSVREKILQCNTMIEEAFKKASVEVRLRYRNNELGDGIVKDTAQLLSALNSILSKDSLSQLVAINHFAQSGSELGWTFHSPILSKEFGVPGCVSVVFVGNIRNTFSHPPYSWRTDQISNVTCYTCVHELGHSRADLNHTDTAHSSEHSTKLCIMSGVLVDGLTMQLIELRGNLFCDSCISRIEARKW